MELYIILKRNPKVNVWGVAFSGRVFTDYHDAALMLYFYKNKHPHFDSKIIAFNMVDEEFEL